jgi:hypothetical protein
LETTKNAESNFVFLCIGFNFTLGKLAYGTLLKGTVS